MSDDVSSLIVRLQILLQDVEGEIWSVSLLTECLRSALRELQAVCPNPLQIAGLDEALTTTLDEELTLSPLLLQIAQQQALLQRQVERSETFHPDPSKQTSTLFVAVEHQDYRAALEKVRCYFLQRSSTSPY